MQISIALSGEIGMIFLETEGRRLGGMLPMSFLSSLTYRGSSLHIVALA